MKQIGSKKELTSPEENYEIPRLAYWAKHKGKRPEQQ